jgi:hypothetical protein
LLDSGLSPLGGGARKHPASIGLMDSGRARARCRCFPLPYLNSQAYIPCDRGIAAVGPAIDELGKLVIDSPQQE